MTNDVFELATRKKYRFPFNGQISVEDLWELTITQLDRVYKTLMEEKKTGDEESLLSVMTAADTDLNNRIELVRYIFETKQAEKAEAAARAEREEQNRRIREMIATKKIEALAGKSIEELEALLRE